MREQRSAATALASCLESNEDSHFPRCQEAAVAYYEGCGGIPEYRREDGARPVRLATDHRHPRLRPMAYRADGDRSLHGGESESSRMISSKERIRAGQPGGWPRI